MRLPRLALLMWAVACAGCNCKDPLEGQCAQGDRAACVAFTLKAREPREAEVELKKTCGAGQVEACIGLGDLYAQPGTALAGPLLPTRKKTCSMGSGLGCRKLGELLSEGDYPHRVNVDPSGATGAFDRGCKLGDGPACIAFGDRVAAGRGANVDAPVAAEAWARACKLGERPACDKAEAARAPSKP